MTHSRRHRVAGEGGRFYGSMRGPSSAASLSDVPYGCHVLVVRRLRMPPLLDVVGRLALCGSLAGAYLHTRIGRPMLIVTPARPPKEPSIELSVASARLYARRASRLTLKSALSSLAGKAESGIHLADPPTRPQSMRSPPPASP